MSTKSRKMQRMIKGLVVSFITLILVGCQPSIKTNKKSEGQSSSSGSELTCTVYNYIRTPIVDPMTACHEDPHSVEYFVTVKNIKTVPCVGGYRPTSIIESVKCYRYFKVSAGIPTVTPTPSPSPSPTPTPTPTVYPPSSNYSDNPLFSYAWHLDNRGQKAAAVNGGVLGADLNVLPVWDSGISGNGVRVLVADDGIDSDHPDLNIDITTSRDFEDTNSSTNIGKPPKHKPNDSQAGHGTGCSGLIGASNNSIGSLGVSYGATLSGYNVLAYQSDSAFSETWGNNFDVYNFSFGEGTMGYLDLKSYHEETLTHLRTGATAQRNSKGSVYVWALGNSYEMMDADCMDPAFAEPYILPVAALNSANKKALYSSEGSCVWISGYGGEDRTLDTQNGPQGTADPTNLYPQMITTDIQGCGANEGYALLSGGLNSFDKGTDELNKSCDYTSMFNGTSSAAPTVTGVVALIMEANSSLRMRDIKHILAKSARKVDPSYVPENLYSSDINYVTSFKREEGWGSVNGAGYSFSNWYGFGAVDSEAAVNMARTAGAVNLWSAGEMLKDVRSFPSAIATVGKDSIDPSKIGKKELAVSNSNISFIESVQVNISMRARDIADLQFVLISPSGKRSIMFTTGTFLYMKNDFENLRLIANNFYGENPNGIWRVEVIDGIVGHFFNSNLFKEQLNMMRDDYSTEAEKEEFDKIIQAYRENLDSSITDQNVSAEIKEVKLTIFGH